MKAFLCRSDSVLLAKVLLTLPILYLAYGVPVTEIAKADTWLTYLSSVLAVPDVPSGYLSLSVWACACHTVSEAFVSMILSSFE